MKQTGDIDEQKEGMDIAYCVLDMKTNKMQYSGANSPIFIISNSQNLNNYDKTENLYIIKPDYQPIGIYFNERAFKS